jgi:glycosyltransferase involved in cell wall biosynthesis
VREHIIGNRDLKSLLPPRIAMRLIAHFSDHIIANSHAVRTAFAGVAPADKVSVVHNGIDVTKFAQCYATDSGFREELALPRETRVVTIVGSITPRKRHTVFVEAAAELIRVRSSTAFVVVGAGDSVLVADLRSQVERAGLANHFHFLGWRADVPRILCATDVLVVASDQEGFGRTLLEAMASGVPVIATRSGGPEEIIVESESGLLVPVDDASGLARAIAAILDDASLAAALAQRGRDRVERAFTLQACVDAITRVLLGMAGRDVKAALAEGHGSAAAAACRR